MTLTCSSAKSIAGPLSAQPLIGLVSEYSSNPVLLTDGAHSETTAALLLESPIRCDLDSLHFSLVPRIRYGTETGYSSLTSDYYHVDASAQYVGELDSLTLDGALYRDSSLNYIGGLSHGVGVRHDTSTAGVDWLRTLTERLQFDLVGTTTRTLFGKVVGVAELQDYRYTSGSPTISYAVTELDTARILGGIARYYSLDGSTASQSHNLQIGYDRKLSEIWTLSTAAGYSTSTNYRDIDLFHFYLGTFKSHQDSATFSGSLTRQGERVKLVLSASRAQVPTGQAFLSRQDSLNVTANFTQNERWTYSTNIVVQNDSDPLTTGGTSTRRFFLADVSAQWHWTEQWTVAMHLSKVTQDFPAQNDQPSASPTSNSVTLQITRQFYATNQ
jgi:hypothetical protein